MFAMVVLFGLFHGLIFLPVVLSLIGPQEKSVSGRPKESGSVHQPSMPAEVFSNKSFQNNDECSVAPTHVTNEKITAL